MARAIATADHHHRLPGDPPSSAAEGVAFLERNYRRWHDGIAALDEDRLSAPLGPKGARFANDPMAELIAHAREVMPHGGETCLLRDLYRGPGAKARESRLIPG